MNIYSFIFRGVAYFVAAHVVALAIVFLGGTVVPLESRWPVAFFYYLIHGPALVALMVTIAILGVWGILRALRESDPVLEQPQPEEDPIIASFLAGLEGFDPEPKPAPRKRKPRRKKEAVS